MDFIKKNLVTIVYTLLVTTLFMPWILVPDPETLTIQTASGLQFLFNRLPILLFMIFIILTYVLSLKNKNMNIFILLELEIVFLLGLLLAPVFYLNPSFFVGVKYGYYFVLIILLILAFYYYRVITRKITKKTVVPL